MIEIINQTQRWSFEKINKTNLQQDGSGKKKYINCSLRNKENITLVTAQKEKKRLL